MRPRAGALLCLALLGASASARASPGVRANVRVEAGAEHDSNATRAETVEGAGAGTPVVGSPLGRFAASADLLALPGGRTTLSLGGGLAGKRFLDERARGEDVLVGEGRASAGTALGESTSLSLALAYYEIFQRAGSVAEARDFRSLLPSARVEQRLGPAQLYAGGGYRRLVWKPAPDFDFSGPTAFLGYRQERAVPLGEEGGEWEWGVAASFDQRDFTGPACASLEDCAATPAEPRRDRFFVVQADATRTGDALLGAGVALHLNQSNSFGETLRRVVGHLRGVFLLPASLSLAARLEVVATSYADPVPVGHDPSSDRFVPLEQENRSTLRLELVRPLGALIDVGARYTFYTSAPQSGPVAFSRQTVSLFLALGWER